MKTSSLKKFAWVFFALALTTGTVFGQGWRNGNRSVNRQNGTCLTTISGLTEEQQNQILAMDEKHQGTMDELRTQRRATTDPVEKSEIRTTMLKNVEAHRNAVKSLLSEDQKLQYDQLHSALAYGPNQNVGNRRGSNGSRGQGAGYAQGARCGKQQANSRGNRGGYQNLRRGTCIYN